MLLTHIHTCVHMRTYMVHVFAHVSNTDMCVDTCTCVYHATSDVHTQMSSHICVSTSLPYFIKSKAPDAPLFYVLKEEQNLPIKLCVFLSLSIFICIYQKSSFSLI